MTAKLRSRVSKCLARFARAESGVTAIEFAFVAPVMLLMSGIMLETGVVLFSEYSLQSGVQRAARDVKIGNAQTGAFNLAAFRDRICTLAKAGIKCSDVNVYMKPFSSFNTMYTSMPNILDVGNVDPVTGKKNANYSCGGESEAVALVATYDWKFNIPYFMRPFGNIDNGNTRRLVAISVFRNEPFGAGKNCSTS